MLGSLRSHKLVDKRLTYGFVSNIEEGIHLPFLEKMRVFDVLFQMHPQVIRRNDRTDNQRATGTFILQRNIEAYKCRGSQTRKGKRRYPETSEGLRQTLPQPR